MRRNPKNSKPQEQHEQIIQYHTGDLSIDELNAILQGIFTLLQLITLELKDQFKIFGLFVRFNV